MIGKIILFVLISLIAQFICGFIYTLGFHIHVVSHAPGPCRLIPGADEGSEGMQTLPSGLTIISSGLSVAEFSDIKRKGKMLLFDFNNPQNNVVELKFNEEFDAASFNPHGMSLWEDEKSGEVYVFVVSHHSEGDRIEKFTFLPEENKIHHTKTYLDPIMTGINDVAATGPDSFYFTNMFHLKSKYLKLLDMYMHWGNVVNYDGRNYQTVIPRLGCPNGVALSLDKMQLYLTALRPNMIYVYNIHQNNSLSLKLAHSLFTAGDNPIVDMDTGDVWLGCHPVMYKVLDHLVNPTHPTPSQVLRLKFSDESDPVVTEVYSDDGKQLYGSSTASRYKGHMLVGTMIHGLLYCELRSEEPYYN